MNREIQAGDLFSIEVAPKQFIFGRVVFDVYNQYFEKLPSTEQCKNYLDWFENCYLVETFLGVHSSLDTIDFCQKATKGTFVNNDFYKEDFMKERGFCLVGNKKINPTEIFFPETLLNDENKIYFTTGELCLPIKLSLNTVNEKINIFPSFGSGYYEIIIATLDQSNRKDLIEDKEDLLDNYYNDSDLHSLPDARKMIYNVLKENFNLSYFELSLKHGYDINRLYK